VRSIENFHQGDLPEQREEDREARGLKIGLNSKPPSTGQICSGFSCVQIAVFAQILVSCHSNLNQHITLFVAEHLGPKVTIMDRRRIVHVLDTPYSAIEWSAKVLLNSHRQPTLITI